LNSNAKKIFKYIVSELTASNILCNLDIYVLTNCAIAIDRIQEVEKILNEDILNKDALKLKESYIGDECGAMDDYPVKAMRSSQITLKNKLGIIISTQYPNDSNVMLTEIDYAKMVLDELIENKRYFSLLYEPNEDIRKEWKTNKLVIYQSNPVAVDNEKIFKSIVNKRTMAILYESKRENYLCKHNNILYKGLGVDGHVNSEQIRACKQEKEWDWKGKKIFIGSDGAESFDNSSYIAIGI